MFKKLFILIMCAALFQACQKKSSEETSGNSISKDFIGEWKVQWVTKPESGNEFGEGVNYTMNGTMTFTDSKLTINAYGYEGCVFGQDTLSHTLNWTVQNDTLNVINEGDEFGIPYIIKEASDNKVKLQLVEDVFLFLTR